MPDIVLIQPPVEDYYFTFKRSIPYGLACIAAALGKYGFSVEIIDGLAVNKSKIIKPPEKFSYLEKYYGTKDISPFSLFHEFRHYGYSFEHIGKLVRDKKPFLAGISSLFTPYSKEALRTAQVVKKFFPRCKIVMGGHHPSVLPENAMESKYVDFLLRGEGEVSMPVLAHALKNGIKLENVPGIVFRKKDGSLYIDEPAWIDNFIDHPLPDFNLVNHKFYKRKNKGCTVMVTSRGCPMKCSYCSVGASSSNATFRNRSVDSVIQELESQIERYDIGFIDFEDENLTLNRSWFLALAEKMEKLFQNRTIELRAMNGLFPPSLDEEIIAAMKKTGFKTLNLSLGSTSKAQLKAFKRPDIRKSFEKVLVLAEKYSMETVSYIIAGAPGQTAYQSVKDLLYLADRRTLAGLSIYYPAPGSLDYNVCINKGVIPEHYSLMRSSALPISDTTTRLEASTLLRLARITNFIKFIIDQNHDLPAPEPFNCPSGNAPYSSEYRNDSGINNYDSIDVKNRTASGIKLLSWFLFDGIIRGITPHGRIFAHLTEKKLSKQFLQGLKKIL